MSKAFVIKNKEGKYLKEDKNIYGDDTIHWYDIVSADIYTTKEIAEFHKEPFYRDCEVVEITIAEGDFEQQLAEKEKQLEIYKNLERYDVGELLNENIKLRARINTIRKQVCDRINHHISNLTDEANSGSIQYLTIDVFEFQEFLDRTEKGEQQ